MDDVDRDTNHGGTADVVIDRPKAESPPKPATNGAAAAAQDDQNAERILAKVEDKVSDRANGASNGSPARPARSSSQPADDRPFSWLQPHVQFVVVFAGPEEVPFGIQLNFLCARSSFFKEKFKSEGSRESLEHIVKLPDTTAEVFGHAQHFLFTGEVSPDAESIPSYETLIGLWKLGHMLGIEGLCDRTLQGMIDCRVNTGRIPATPLLVQVWKDTPEGSSLRKLLLSWAAEYMRSSDGRHEFAKSLPQEVLSELVVAMSSLEAQPFIPPAPSAPSATSAPIAGTVAPNPRKTVHYLEDDELEAARGSKIRRVSGPTASNPSVLPPLAERKPPAVRKLSKASIPKRRSSGAAFTSDGEITTERKVEFCADLLDRMLSGPGFWTRLVGPFKEPVDPEKDQVPDYFKKVKKPMDLVTIKAKMDRREYTTEQEFVHDVRQIFKNCYAYWSKSDPMWAACEKFQRTFEDKYSQMTKTILKLMREPAE